MNSSWSATVSSVTAMAILGACVDRGLDVSRLLERAGLPWQRQFKKVARIPAETVLRLWQEAENQAGRPGLALDAAERGEASARAKFT